MGEHPILLRLRRQGWRGEWPFGAKFVGFCEVVWVIFVGGGLKRKRCLVFFFFFFSEDVEAYMLLEEGLETLWS